MTQADELRVARERLIAVLYEAGLGPTISEDLARMIEGLIDAKLGPVRVVGSLIGPSRPDLSRPAHRRIGAGHAVDIGRMSAERQPYASAQYEVTGPGIPFAISPSATASKKLIGRDKFSIFACFLISLTIMARNNWASVRLTI